MMLLLVRTTPLEQVQRRTEGLSVLLVDLREVVDHGLTIQPIKTMMNHFTNQLYFDDMEVPVTNLIGEEGQGFRYILDGMNVERILIAAECMGDGAWFIERATAYANERQVFGRPHRAEPGSAVSHRQSLRELTGRRPHAVRAAELYDQGKPCGPEANMAKLLGADASWRRPTWRCRPTAASASPRSFDIERKFRETRLYQVAPVSTNLILAYVGQNVLGMPRSY